MSRFIHIMEAPLPDARFWKIFQAVVPHCHNQAQAEAITKAVIAALARPKKEDEK